MPKNITFQTFWRKVTCSDVLNQFIQWYYCHRINLYGFLYVFYKERPTHFFLEETIDFRIRELY